jgi:hypothetical protein
MLLVASPSMPAGAAHPVTTVRPSVTGSRIRWLQSGKARRKWVDSRRSLSASLVRAELVESIETVAVDHVVDE